MRQEPFGFTREQLEALNLLNCAIAYMIMRLKKYKLEYYMILGDEFFYY